ncbi:hypothetical protein IEQ34_003322 [Dendrobium chrysotoxum]|uniref:Uncharacterized protein n=1 Tax=Dendrobium chrysotoxum TaxID=161865 RepID=A0AAV7HKQ4_DENCH|nr:hypothetical protein IEQ34_003322 [Dendrobium chrysotoxum]
MEDEVNQPRQLNDFPELVRRRRRSLHRRLHRSRLGSGGLHVAGAESRRTWKRCRQLGEVENGGASFDVQSRHVMRARRHFWGGKGPEPNP